MAAGPRIIAGALGGRRLRVGTGVRPTSSRVREALFSIWGDRIDGARLLDLFAGSGAVGLEAASRGAERVVLVESGRGVSVLLGNLRDLAMSRERVLLLRASLPAALRDPRLEAEAPFDLVFADPPYRFTAFAPLLAAAEPLLGRDGEIVIEHRSGTVPPDLATGLRRFDRRAYGESSLSRYRREQPPDH